ncbi:MAG: UDP-N-acetylmuramate dehydrogenase [Bacteroidota bacterium]
MQKIDTPLACMLIDRNISLKSYNTFGLDVSADYMTHIKRSSDLHEVFASKKFQLMKKLVLGGGSNVLFTRHFAGLILKMEIEGIEIVEENAETTLIKVGAGEKWHQLVLWAVEKGLGGIENLSLIPGTVGAAPMQNIGAYGVEQESVFHSLEAFEVSSGAVDHFYKEDCKFGYRNSVFKGDLKEKYIITHVYYRLNKHPEFNISYGNLKSTLDEMGIQQLTLKAISQAVINIRQSKLPDPLEIGNSGSFFKNPVISGEYYQSLKAAFDDIPGYELDSGEVKVPAAWLIEKTGWKGKRQGEIGVHDKQPLVLVNFGGGKGADIKKLSEDIRLSVFKNFGVELEPEVNII